MSDQITVAIDAMGGDNAPSAPVEGAVLAAQNGQTRILLVGDQELLETELEKYDTKELPISIIGSEVKLDDSEAPALALRQKPRASIVVATGLVKAGAADAVISMGSTGGTMAAAVVILGIIKGIERPAIGGPIVGAAPHQTILDLGSNIDCKPSQLLGFGVLGSVFGNVLLKIDNPKIGILSVGSEQSKGNALTKEASALFSKSGLNFIGNVEGNDLVKGTADVVVCDGFVGNVLLKLVEGIGTELGLQLQSALSGKMPPEVVEGILHELYSKNNVVDSRGGGPVFGVNGISIVGHGSASPTTFERAVDLAKMCVETRLIEEMNEQVPRVMALASE